MWRQHFPLLTFNLPTWTWKSPDGLKILLVWCFKVAFNSILVTRYFLDKLEISLMVMNTPSWCLTRGHNSTRLGIHHSCEDILNSDQGLLRNGIHKKIYRPTDKRDSYITPIYYVSGGIITSIPDNFFWHQHTRLPTREATTTIFSSAIQRIRELLYWRWCFTFVLHASLP